MPNLGRIQLDLSLLLSLLPGRTPGSAVAGDHDTNTSFVIQI